MGIAWPINVPQFAESWNETDQPVTVRTNMDVGPPKVRRRYTGPIANIKVQFVGLHQDWVNLKAFFDVDLQGGVLFHTFYNPILGMNQDFRFITPPALTNISALGVQIDCEWERLG